MDRLQKLLLVLITLALAIAPLRGAWALPDIPAVDNESHCAQMQHAIPDIVSMVSMSHDNDAGAPDCKQDCNGSCCDDTCSTCVTDQS